MKTESELKIAEPCSENWEGMRPQEQGKHCDKCCKVVVDFTTMPTENVIAFIQKNNSEKICGRFHSEQVHTPNETKHSSKPYRLFFAALYLVFGSLLFTSCHGSSDKNVMGKVAVEHSYSNEKSFTPSIDSPSKVNPAHVGPNERVCHKPIQIHSADVKPDTTEPEIYKMGEVMYVPNDSLK